MSVVFVAASKLPTPFGEFTMHGFLDEETGKEHVALTMGKLDDGQPVLGRLHSECLTGDTLFSLRCDCGFQLEGALSAIAKEGRGVLLYLRQEGRGIGLPDAGTAARRGLPWRWPTVRPRAGNRSRSAG